MSCYIVSTNIMHRAAAAMMLLAPEHMNVPVDIFNPCDLDGRPLPNDGTSWGNRLFDMNARAFAARYEGRHAADGEAPEYTFKPWPLEAPKGYPRDLDAGRAEFKFPIAELYHGLRNLLYQCAEGDIDKSPLYLAATEVFNKLAHLIARETHAVKALPWGDMPPIPKLPPR